MLLLFVLPISAAEHVFDFGDLREGQTPPGFRSALTGKGKPGEWRILLDEVPPVFEPLSPQAARKNKRPVLAQLSRDTTDDRYALLIYDGETYADFTVKTRFKIVDGQAEQMAGLAFRIQDENNYYYVRASALGNTFYFFKFVKGELIGPIGSKVEISRGEWHELMVECKGSKITCSLDGKALIPQMQQDTFAKGKIGYWTKSDSVSYFCDTKITYIPLEAPAQVIVRKLMEGYPRLLAIKIYVPDKEPGSTRLIASSDPSERGQPGGKSEREVISTGETYYGKEKDSVSVISPVRDRNGDILGAARIVMKTFRGQTEQNAIIRATPIVKQIQDRVTSMEDLVE